MKEDLIKQIKAFDYNNVWKTRKARINAEQRLLLWHNFIQFLLNWYSVSLLSLSVLTLVKPNQDLDIWNIIISIILLGITFSVTLLDFQGSANEFKKSYIDISDISMELKDLMLKLIYESDDNSDIQSLRSKYFEIQKEYNSLLRNSQNHKEVDYQKVLIEIKELSVFLTIKYYFKKVMIYLVFFILLLLPICLIFSVFF